MQVELATLKENHELLRRVYVMKQNILINQEIVF